MQLLQFLALAAPSAASTLYAASYAGTVSSLSLSPLKNGTEHLSVISQTSDCGHSPSWLMLDRPNDILYCLDEAVNAPTGSITSFKAHSNGSLSTIHHVKTMTGPVQSTLYQASSDRHFMAVAHYEASAITTYSVNTANGLFKPLQTFTYTLPQPGPNPSRQDAPHPHGVVVDPTGRFVLSPDLGADYVRIFAINPSTGKLQPQDPLVVTPGSGPRHAVFWTPKDGEDDGQTYMYLTSELVNTLSAFRVEYTAKGISFVKVFEHSVYGEKSAPAGSKVAELAISPSNTHVLITNRLDNTFGKNNDSFAIFSCADPSGNTFTQPSFLGLKPAYGSNPRQFEFKPDGSLVAVAMQDTHGVVVTRWDAKAGKPGSPVATKGLKGEIPAVIWA